MVHCKGPVLLEAFNKKHLALLQRVLEMYLFQLLIS